MPIGLVSPQPLNVGVTPTAPVTVAAPQVTPDAVSQLVDAFHKGVITSQDLISHIGTVAAAKDRSTMQELREYVSPKAIEARQSALGAATAQNNLATQTAQAQAGLVQPTANLASLQTQKATAGQVYGPLGNDAFDNYAFWFGKHASDPEFMNPDGSPNFAARVTAGNQMAAQMNLANAWLQRLTPAKAQEVTDSAGNKAVKQLNQFGTDVTPPGPQPDGSWYPGSAAYQAYVKQLDNYLPDAHPARANYMFTPHKSSSVAPGIYKSPADAAGATSQGTPPTLVTPQAQNTEPTPAPVIQPAVPISNAPGIITEQAKGDYQTPTQIKTDLFANPIVKSLAEQRGYANAFAISADKMEQSGATVRGTKNLPPQNVNDLGLVESLIKLYDPQATIREFKWDKITSDQPLLERLKSIGQTVMNKGTLTPEERQRIIEMGDEVINSKEAAARPAFQQYADIAKRSAVTAGSDPNTWLNATLDSDQQRVLNGQPFRVPKASPAASASAAPAAATPGKRVVTFGAGPYKGRQMIDNGDGSFTPVQ